MNNSKITKKLIKYFLFTITLVIFICFLISSTFLSKLYTNEQYKNLKSTGQNIYNSLKNEDNIKAIDNNALIISNSTIIPLTKSKMSVIHMIKDIGIENIQEKDRLTTKNNESFLIYKLDTDLGTIVTFQNAAPYSEFLKIIYLVLISVFIVAIIISIPIFYFLGKKFTDPILELKDISNEIAKGNFQTNKVINTKDEIEELYSSINNMSLKLKEKYSFQRKFIANISHDFKTPLSVIRNYSEAINDGVVPEEEISQYSREIINEVDKLNSMVIDLLEISKLQEGQLKLNLSHTNLQEFLKECCDRFTSISKQNNINIDLISLNKEVLIDKNLIQRVMYNFINNALNFSPNGSIIEIISSSTPHGIKVSVEDHGCGIPDSIIQDIWSRYYKNSQSGGIGLGLPICKEILETHGFSYGVTSKEGNGSIFYFVIPKKNIV